MRYLSIVFSGLKLFIFNFCMGSLSATFIKDNNGFWFYFPLLHLISYSIVIFLGGVAGISAVNSQVKTKSKINKRHCYIIFIASRILVLLLASAWFVILLPHLVNLLTKDLLTGLFLSGLFIFVILGGAVMIMFVALPHLWLNGSLFLVFFNRQQAFIILLIITIVGSCLGYRMGMQI